MQMSRNTNTDDDREERIGSMIVFTPTFMLSKALENFFRKREEERISDIYRSSYGWNLEALSSTDSCYTSAE